MSRFQILFMAVASFVLISCNNQGNDGKVLDTPTSGEIVIAVDETFQPILEAVSPVFHAIYKKAKVNITYMPEVDAFKQMLTDSVRMIVVPRPLSEKELSYFKGKTLNPKQVKLALDGIAILVHPSNRDTLLTVQQMKDIFLGNITDWNQINPASKLGNMKVIFDNPNSSIVRYVVDSITHTGDLGSQLSSMKYNKDVVDFVAETPNALGLIGVSWVSDRNDPSCLSFLNKVNVVAISKEEIAIPENSYQPYQAYIATGKYPFTRYIYMINTEPRVGLETGFSAFAAGDKGQRIILKTGILPYTQPVRIIQVNKN